jgi:hypothetical protein
MTEAEQVTIVRVRGRLRNITLPPRCPSCGGAAGVTLRVERVFARERRRRGITTDMPRGVTTFHVASINVPFCTACAARHMAERATAEPVPSPLRTTAAMYGVVAGVALVAALFFAVFIWNASAGGWRPTLTFAASIAVGCAVFAGWFAVQAINALRAGATLPPTSITAAFDFSDRQCVASNRSGASIACDTLAMPACLFRRMQRVCGTRPVRWRCAPPGCAVSPTPCASPLRLR